MKHYRGHLQVDAYVAYDAFFTKPERGTVEVGCWPRARRHVYQAVETNPSRMRTILWLIAELYRVEKLARQRGLGGRGPAACCVNKARIRFWKSCMLTYSNRISNYYRKAKRSGGELYSENWTALTRYAENPDLSIDNNHTERSVRGWAVGRNSGRFFGRESRRPHGGFAAS